MKNPFEGSGRVSGDPRDLNDAGQTPEREKELREFAARRIEIGRKMASQKQELEAAVRMLHESKQPADQIENVLAMIEEYEASE